MNIYFNYSNACAHSVCHYNEWAYDRCVFPLFFLFLPQLACLRIANLINLIKTYDFLKLTILIKNEVRKK